MVRNSIQYFSGTFPNVSRNAIVNVSEIVCYDIIKDTILYYHLLSEGVPLHLSAAVVAGKYILLLSEF